ncbi:hypothetical protein [Pseudomonas sp. NPDC086278]|uniref:hypothetical protein n=1 Tax=Pseudomonas sp. NPDC086278 TaxID=3390646 RepID=UPI003D003544
MDTTSRAAAIESCESILRKEYQYNKEKEIWSTINKRIEGLLARTNELADVYVELRGSLGEDYRALKSFFDVLNLTVYSWNPGKIKDARQDREQLTDLNIRIVEAAKLLSDLISRRTEVQEISSFRSDTYYHVIDVVRDAAESNGLFSSHVEGKLENLTYQYDLKYWPSISEVVSAIGANAQAATTVARSPAASAATDARRPGLSDFLRAFEAALDENRVRRHGFIPNKFSVSNNSTASLINCALELEVDDLIDGSFVKRFRQRERERKVGQVKVD